MYCYKVSKRKPILPYIYIVISIFLIGIIIYLLNNNSNNNQAQYNIIKTGSLTNIENSSNKDSIENTLENMMSSIVGISSIKPDGSSIFTLGGTEKWGTGTGFIVSSNGYIVTNQHVGGNKGNKTSITLSDGTSYTGKTIWADEVIDLAIIKIDASNLNYATLGDSNNIKIGQTVYAIGNPIGFEFQRTVTSGIISAKNRTIKLNDTDTSSYMEDLIQTDASINTGNSGGPLINAKGEVIGINTVKISEAESIGFAIPINLVKPIIEKFITNGEFNEPYIGIFAYDKQVIPYLNSSIKLDKGIYIAQIDNGGPAQKANLKVGDIITSIDNQEVNTMVELRTIIYEKSPKDTITLTILRANKEYQVQITLDKKD